jgi:cell division protein FtsB
MVILNYVLERPWTILTVLAVVVAWILIDFILRTIRAQKTIEKMEEHFKKLDAEHEEMEQKVKDISDLGIDKEVRALEEKLKEALKKLPEEPPENK